MYERKSIQLRLKPGLHEQIKERCETHGLSINEWINRAVEFTIAAKSPEMTITEIRKARL